MVVEVLAGEAAENQQIQLRLLFLELLFPLLGFLNIDCGYGENKYNDTTTGMSFTSDSQYIDTGVNYDISRNYMTSSFYKQNWNLRSFPNGIRNCYTLSPVNQGSKYMVRATFLHGSYDGQESISDRSPLLFDLYLGVNFWATVNVSSVSFSLEMDIITVSTADYFSLCLINTGHGTPFISSIQVRLINNNNMYGDVNQSVSLSGYARLNLGGSANVRYPDDHYDRIWYQYNFYPYWLSLNSTSDIQSSLNDAFQVPSAVMSTAVTPADNESLKFYWFSAGGTIRPEYYIYLHFAEFDSLTGKENRTFQVTVGGHIKVGAFSPTYLLTTHIILSTLPTATLYNFSIMKTEGSTLPPILHAVEIYTSIILLDLATDRGDVEAMMEIKALYHMKRNWQGDPCVPSNFTWDGIMCSFANSNPPRVISLNMSSSGLTGNIPTALRKLSAIQNLDLSNNSLTGPIPDFLAGLPSLQLLILSSNQLEGTIPSVLNQRKINGLLDLRTDGNPICNSGATCGETNDTNNKTMMVKKKTIPTAPIVVAVVVVAAGLLLVVIFVLWRKRQGSATSTVPIQQPEQPITPGDYNPVTDSRQFAHEELKAITKNFQRIIGKGGFGTVYHGALGDGTQVAVKMRSDQSRQGTKEFHAEAQHLSRVHHRNLVSLVGYCKDSTCKALIYEYMAQGSLKEHLEGKAGNPKALTWRVRLKIALEAAQGLEYLHKGCDPPLIHRDVKTSNILLSHNLEAKLADFGLSKAFQSNDQTHISTAVAGTLGYLDPEYHNLFQLSEKSDVYSFGVVLLELITGKPAILTAPEKSHIVPWVRLRLAKGDMDDLVDKSLRGEYDVNSVWKVADVAMKCTTLASAHRPVMADVVIQLKECLALEVSREKSQNLYEVPLDVTYSGSVDIAHLDLSGSMIGPSAR